MKATIEDRLQALEQENTELRNSVNQLTKAVTYLLAADRINTATFATQVEVATAFHKRLEGLEGR